MVAEVQRRSALKTSIKEGSAANASFSFGDQYITPAVLALQGNAGHIGILSALTGILGPAAQFIGNKFQKKYTDKKIVTHAALLQVIFWFSVSLFSLLASKQIILFPVYALIAIYVLIVVVGGILYPAFFSWLGSLVKKDERGKYFSNRGAIIGAVSIVTAVIAAWILDIFTNKNQILLGFAVLFGLAGISRAISYIYFTKQYAPSKRSHVIELPWKNFVSTKNNLGKFTLGMSAFNFALMIASPFFAVYLLQERGYSYITFTIIMMSSAAWNLLFLPLVGKFSDKYGNAPLLNLAGVLFTITPPMWILLDSPILIALIPQMLNGIANAAFGIGFSNYIYANVQDNHRGTAVAHINALSGLGVVIGSLLGGFILSKLGSWSNIFLIVFLLATLSRGIVSMFFLSKLKDVHNTRRKIIQFDIIHPLKTIYHDTRIVRNLLEKK